MVGSNIPLISGMTNYSNIQSQIVKSNGIETVYQTYALIQSALASWQTTGDFLLLHLRVLILFLQKLFLKYASLYNDHNSNQL